MSPRRDRLERGIAALFEQAYRDGRTEVAEHLLRALEAIDGTDTDRRRAANRSTLSRAYLLIASGS